MFDKKKINQFIAWLLMAAVMAMLVLLFVFKDTLISFTSRSMQQQISPISQKIFTDSVDHLYNYSVNEHNFRYTLLEFSGAGCNICRKMEIELEALKKSHGNDYINVVIYQMTRPNGLQWGKYFGIVMIPTQVILDRTGKEMFRNTGFMSKDDLLDKME